MRVDCDRGAPGSPSDERDTRTFAIIGAAMEVHKQLGGGFLEQVYHEALAVELAARGVPYAREIADTRHIQGNYIELLLSRNCFYRADFVFFGEIIVEPKAIKVLTDVDLAQVINYLKATELKRALLFNFHAPRLDYKRLVL